jgi:formylglycine-generating enzyme required for sulfatase activity
VAKLLPESTTVSILSDPPGAEFFTEDGTPLARDKRNSAVFSVPRGLKKVVARHTQLGSLTNQFESRADGGEPLRFNFAYGTLVLTNLPASATLYEGNSRIGAATDGGVYQRPGSHQYSLRGPAASQELQLTIQPGFNYLRLATSEKSWKNNIGMWFAWVPNLPGGGAWPGQSVAGGWVGISEVTQGQYKRMDGTNPSVYRQGGDNYPVENVTWDQAMNYCRWLTSTGASECGGWRYTLPSDEQFNAFGGDADRVARVTAEGRMNSTMEDVFLPAQRAPRIPAQQNLNNARAHPEPVASTKQPNLYGLYDVVGNVWEWLAGPGGKDNSYAGGSYLNFSQKTIGVRAREKSAQKGPGIGFRVILVPPQ